MQSRRNKLLASEARIHRHHQYIVHNIEHFGQEIHWRSWIDHHSRQTIMSLNQVQRAIQVPAGFLMHRNPIRARLSECGNEFVRIFDHQMAIERQFRNPAQRFDHRRTDSEIGDKMPVHNVHVHDTGAALAGGTHLLAKTGKVSRKNRWCQFDQA